MRRLLYQFDTDAAERLGGVAAKKGGE